MKNIIVKCDDGSTTLYSEKFGESYHSTKGAITESSYIFIECGLSYYVKQTRSIQSSNHSVTIMEIGFGTGLNALLSCIFAEKHKIKIRYISVEKFPLTLEQITALHHAENISPNDSNIKDYSNKIHSAQWNQEEKISNYFSLYKAHSDIENFSINHKLDVIYFDAFSPERQPEMWKKEIFQNIHNSLSDNGVLVTYSSKGIVKQRLRDCGFEVQRLPGPTGKRHIIRALAQSSTYQDSLSCTS